MKKVIIGSIAVLFGVIIFSVFPLPFFTLLAGSIPFILIIGGGLTIYLNYEKYLPGCCGTTDCKDDSSNSCETSPVKSQGIKPENRSMDESIVTGGQFSGNTESRVFHNSDCNFATSKKCTAVFHTREEAIEKGYKPCGICNP
jgi:hypothetical protein